MNELPPKQPGDRSPDTRHRGTSDFGGAFAENRPVHVIYPSVKCVVWDLDGCLWQGILLEDGRVSVAEPVKATVLELDRRGVLQSIASRNDPEAAMAQLTAVGLRDYFLVPQIGWQDKWRSIEVIAAELRLSLDVILFIDDSPFERGAIAHHLPEVRCLDIAQLPELLDRPELPTSGATSEAQSRRELYATDLRRRHDESSFTGSSLEFLRKLNLRMTAWTATRSDLARVGELILRTHQLNTTGRHYTEQELMARIESTAHSVLVCDLQDIYGYYGTVGLSLIEHQSSAWLIELFLMSCRVMNRNAGGAFLAFLVKAAAAAGTAVEVEFIPTKHNRPMLVTYRLSGFKSVGRSGGSNVLFHEAEERMAAPDYVTVIDRVAWPPAAGQHVTSS